MAYCTNWHAPFFFIGRHLESVSRTELILELNLAPSEERLICEFRSDSDNFYQVIVFRSQVATFVPGQSSKVTEPFPGPRGGGAGGGVRGL